MTSMDASHTRFLIAAFAALSLLLSLVPTARASHRPRAYCSETGDLCQSTTKIDGIRKLRIRTAAHYFDRYRLCVLPADGTVTCKSFSMHERDSGIWVGSVQWSEHFPNEGRGAYTVTWKLTSGERLGRRLGFHY